MPPRGCRRFTAAMPPSACFTAPLRFAYDAIFMMPPFFSRTISIDAIGYYSAATLLRRERCYLRALLLPL